MCEGLNLQYAVVVLLFCDKHVQAWEIANRRVNACVFAVHTREHPLVHVLPARNASLDEAIISSWLF